MQNRLVLHDQIVRASHGVSRMNLQLMSELIPEELSIGVKLRREYSS